MGELMLRTARKLRKLMPRLHSNVLKRMKEARGLSAPNAPATTSPERFAGASRQARPQARPAVKKTTKATGKQAPNGLTVVPRLPTRAPITSKLAQKTLSVSGMNLIVNNADILAENCAQCVRQTHGSHRAASQAFPQWIESIRR